MRPAGAVAMGTRRATFRARMRAIVHGWFAVFAASLGASDCLASTRAEGGDPAAIDAHLAGTQQLLEVAEGEVREVRLEPAVKAHSGLVRSDGSGFDACHARLEGVRNRLHSTRRPA